MAKESGSMKTDGRQPSADSSTSVKKSDMPWHKAHEDAEQMRSDIRELEEDLVTNIAALKRKLSATKLKARAKEELRYFAINRPKAALSTVGETGGDLLRRFLETSKDQPIIPVAFSTVFVGIAALRRILKGR